MMHQKPDLSDDDLLKGIKQRLDGSEREHFFDQRLRTLSVDVLAARDRRRQRARKAGRLALAIGSTGAVVVLMTLMPFSSPEPRPAADGAVATQPDVATNTELAMSYVDEMIEEESIDMLAEAAAPEPILLTDEDIDHLFEGL